MSIIFLPVITILTDVGWIFSKRIQYPAVSLFMDVAITDVTILIDVVGITAIALFNPKSALFKQTFHQPHSSHSELIYFYILTYNV